MTGLTSIQPQDGETMSQARSSGASASYLQRSCAASRAVVPLGPLTFSLRDQYGGEVFERAFPAVVSQIEQQRSTAGADADDAPR
jgi:hypothetical protein